MAYPTHYKQVLRTCSAFISSITLLNLLRSAIGQILLGIDSELNNYNSITYAVSFMPLIVICYTELFVYLFYLVLTLN